MIRKALKQLIVPLNAYLNQEYNTVGDSYVSLNHLSKDTFTASGGNEKIHANLINIEEDKVFRNQFNALPNRAANSTDPMHPLGGIPTMRLNLYVLFVFNPGKSEQDYEDALSLLTKVMTYFQSNLNQALNIPGHLPSPDFVVEINYHNISMEDAYNMWSNLGGEQKPCAMYQIRMLQLQANTDAVLPVAVLQTPQLSNPQTDTAGNPTNDHSIQHK